MPGLLRGGMLVLEQILHRGDSRHPSRSLPGRESHSDKPLRFPCCEIWGYQGSAGGLQEEVVSQTGSRGALAYQDKPEYVSVVWAPWPDSVYGTPSPKTPVPWKLTNLVST